MKNQQPPPPHRQDPDPARPPPGNSPRGNSPDELTAPPERPPSTPPWQRPAWLSRMSQLAGRRPSMGRKLALGAVVVGVLAFVFGLRSPSPSAPQQTASDTRQFSITNRPTLVFDHFIGNVNIVPGPDGRVSIKEKRNGETDSITINYAQHGDTITVTVDIDSGLMVDTWVDFDVQVPRQAGLNATVATGTLEATDLGGGIALNNTNGAIWATNLTGTIGLKTQSGSINLTNVNAQVTVATQNGTVTTTATQLQGHSSIQAQSGTINFHGKLSQTGSYLFQNSNGAVGLTLPSSSAFVLAARSAGGSINSEFQGVTVAHINGHSEARGAVGKAAHAQLTIQTAGGSIDLHQGG